MPDGFESAPYRDPFEGYAGRNPYSDSGFAKGIVGGIVAGIERRKRKAYEQEESARGNALKFLQTIPMTEHNAPIVTKMALEILSAKPGKKHWADQVFGSGGASNRFVDDIWGKLRSILPQQMADSPEAMAQAMPQVAKESRPKDEREERIFPPGVPPFTQMEPMRNMQEPTQGRAAGAPFTGYTPPATRPRRVDMNIPGSQLQPQGRERVVGGGSVAGQPMTGADVLAARPRPSVDPNRISFEGLPGKYQFDNTVYYDDDGNAFGRVLDTRTGKWQMAPLGGSYTTERQRIADIQGKSRQDAIDARESVKLQAKVAGLAGYSLEQFEQLPPAVQQQFYDQYGKIALGTAMGNLAKTSSQTELNKANLPVAKARADLYNRTAQLGGLTPAQVLADNRANLMAARKFAEEHDELAAKAAAAKQALYAHDNPSTPIARTMNKIDPERETKRNQLQQAYTQAQMAVEAKRAAAEQAFPGLLRLNGDKLIVTPNGGSTYQGGANTGAMARPRGPEYTNEQYLQQGYSRSSLGVLPEAGGTTVTPDQFGAIKAVENVNPLFKGIPQEGFKGTPPPIKMQMGPKKITGTATNPATNYRVGQSIHGAGGSTLIITKINPPGPGQPYGSVEASPGRQ